MIIKVMENKIINLSNKKLTMIGEFFIYFFYIIQ